MNEQLELLKKLQEIDSEILSLADKADQLSKKIGKDSLILKEARASYEAAKSRHEEAVKKRKGKELELKELHEKIEKSKAKSGALKTNKEYEAHLREIESLKKATDDIEVEILNFMEDADKLAKILNEKSITVKKAEEEWKKDEQLTETDKNKIISEIEANKSKRLEFTGRIEKEHYEFYMDLLKKLGGSAVAEAKDEICQGCNTNIPPQLFNEVKADNKIIHCYYCHRFLYHKEK
ncbi:MAG: hypothetical protein HY809_10775 [Nitrospirae bacterium]|nr:hypothetical protein [Nitrospirota bacterium]